MRNVFLSTDRIQTLFGLVVLVIWVVANFINTRKKQGRPTQTPPPPTESPSSADRTPEDELREFLETLTRQKQAAEPTPPPPPPIPTPAPPVIRVAASPQPRRKSKPVPTAPATAPVVLVQMPAPAAVGAEVVIAKRTPNFISSFRLPTVALPGVRGMMPMPSMSLSGTGGGIRAYSARQLGLNQRRELRRAVRMQAILSTPAGLR